MNVAIFVYSEKCTNRFTIITWNADFVWFFSFFGNDAINWFFLRKKNTIFQTFLFRSKSWKNWIFVGDLLFFFLQRMHTLNNCFDNRSLCKKIGINFGRKFFFSPKFQNSSARFSFIHSKNNNILCAIWIVVIMIYSLIAFSFCSQKQASYFSIIRDFEKCNDNKLKTEWIKMLQDKQQTFEDGARRRDCATHYEHRTDTEDSIQSFLFCDFC